MSIKHLDLGRGKTAFQLGAGESAALSFRAPKRLSISLSKGKPGFATPDRIEYKVSRVPGDFTASNSFDVMLGMLSLREDGRFGAIQVVPGVTYYLNVRLHGPAGSGVMVDTPWFWF